MQVKKKLKKATNKNVTVKVVEGNKDYVKLELNNKSDQCIFCGISILFNCQEW